MNTINTQQKLDWLRSLGYLVTTVGNVTIVSDAEGMVMVFDEHKMSLKTNNEVYELVNWRSLPLISFQKIIAAFDLVPEPKLNEAHAVQLMDKLS